MTVLADRIPINVDSLKVACSSCSLRELCLPVGFAEHEFERLDTLVALRRSVPCGDTLFRSSNPFETVYAVRSGFFKTRVSSEDGRDQVMGFQMTGELLGLDGISTDRHTCDAVALEDSEVCVIPYGPLSCDLRRSRPDLAFGMAMKAQP